MADRTMLKGDRRLTCDRHHDDQTLVILSSDHVDDRGIHAHLFLDADQRAWLRARLDDFALEERRARELLGMPSP